MRRRPPDEERDRSDAGVTAPREAYDGRMRVGRERHGRPCRHKARLLLAGRVFGGRPRAGWAGGSGWGLAEFDGA